MLIHQLHSLWQSGLRLLKKGGNKKLIQAIDKTESYPVRFYRHKKTAAPQQCDYTFLIKQAKAILDKEDHGLLSESDSCLQRRAIALLYRLGAINGGINPEQQSDSLSFSLYCAGAKWKENHPILTVNTLSPGDMDKLREASRYPFFANWLERHPKDAEDFFTWALRDNGNVGLYICYPHLQEMLVASHLNGRLGRYGSTHIAIECRAVAGSSDLEERLVTLLCEGKPVNILDQKNTVTFRGPLTLTVKQIFHYFRNKDFAVGPLELLKNGVTHWNAHTWSWGDKKGGQEQGINLEDPKWWQQLPPFEVLSMQQAKERYGSHLDGNMWNAAATASRGSPNLDFDQSHAYLELAIPLNNGNYAIYPFGKFAIKFPSSLLQAFATIGHTVPATIAYPDENVFYTHRQHAHASFALTPQQGLNLLERIKKDMIKGQKSNFVYQIESENCAKWLQENLKAVLGTRVPNLYRMPLLHTEPYGLVGSVFRGIRSLPKSWQVPVLTTLHLLLGASKKTWIYERGKKVCKSLTRHPFWRSGDVFLPAFLHKQCEEGNRLADHAQLYSAALVAIPIHSHNTVERERGGEEADERAA